VFLPITRSYFKFYDDYRNQHMCQKSQDKQALDNYFRKARQKNFFDFSIYADNFGWEANFLAEVPALGVKSPYFLADLEKKYDLKIPSNGSFQVGFERSKPPPELEDFSDLFLGKVPGVINFYANKHCERLALPEKPWMIYSHGKVDLVVINKKSFKPWLTKCRRCSALGSGDLLGLILSQLVGFSILTKIEGFDGTVSIAFPMNAFALSAGFVRLTPKNGMDELITFRLKK
jgi:hypothetical protein